MTSNDDGFLRAYALEYGAAPDGLHLVPVATHRTCTSHVHASSPPTAAAGSPAVGHGLEKLGVRSEF